MLHGAVRWAMTGEREDKLNSCEQQTLRLMTGVAWCDWFSSEDVGVELLKGKRNREDDNGIAL